MAFDEDNNDAAVWRRMRAAREGMEAENKNRRLEGMIRQHNQRIEQWCTMERIHGCGGSGRMGNRCKGCPFRWRIDLPNSQELQ